LDVDNRVRHQDGERHRQDCFGHSFRAPVLGEINANNYLER
jgi:hypothetical protein